MARDDNKTVLEGQAAIDLWRKGPDVWNTWVDENPIADVDFHCVDFTMYSAVSFEHYKFPIGVVDFSYSRFGKGDISFHSVQFDEGKVDFSNTNFEDGNVDFSHSHFGKGNVDFYGARFGEGNVYFLCVNFGEGNTDFSKARFGKGDLDFYHAQFGNGDVTFSATHFNDGTVDFSGVHFERGDVSFNGTQFGEGDIFFCDSKFGEGYVDYCGVQFGKGIVDFSGVQFGNGYVNFSHTKFGQGNVDFSSALFGKGHVDFYGAQFAEGDVSFYNVQFGDGDVNFSDTQYGVGNVYFRYTLFGKGVVNFSAINTSGQFHFSDVRGATLIKSLSFKFTTFDGPVSLDNNNFDCIPDFTNTKLSHQLSLSHFIVKPKMISKGKILSKLMLRVQKVWFGSQFTYSRKKRTLKLSKKLPWLCKVAAADKQDIDRIRRLKELAETNKHHKLALDLHVEEMKCSRWIETTSKRALFVEFLFDKFGDYGRSIQRPFTGLAMIGALCSPIYYFSRTEEAATITDALYYSFAQMLHLIPSSRASRTEFVSRLFESTDKIPDHVFLLSWFQSLTSIALVFLIGLALRNRFRI
ncbi:pentapeptide repeat-containing protein [Pseudoalteromonas ardens]|uniref:pentapeptide repeat-containing protein n=1 Tax=Pseudoalteromonas ardens TaxID=3048490 RepID=UPI0006764083|nr:pentapeptide repeat-containing protein [Pseudoalteromonas sp. R96]MDK1310265.1 pentapeptide repeat-containing protein [Pseudoalteromonas sp. R96]